MIQLEHVQMVFFQLKHCRVPVCSLCRRQSTSWRRSLPLRIFVTMQLISTYSCCFEELCSE